MAKLYPIYEDILNFKVPPTPGELKMINFLKGNLSDEYEIFFQPFLNGDLPDIVLMRKGGGVLIIEVKDWKLSRYYADANKKWFVKENNTLIKSPIEQVLKYKENMYNLHIQDLLELKLRDYKYWYVVNCAIFFSLENHDDVIDFIFDPINKKIEELRSNNPKSDRIKKTEKKKEKFKTFLEKSVEIIGKDNLNKTFLKKLLEKTWISKRSIYFKEDLYNSFKRYLKPSFHSIEDGKNIKYTKKQEEFYNSKPGAQKIRGVVGSGKTLVLAKRAVNAVKRTQEKVLILTYNISLRNYIHDKISDVREDFEWRYFHIVNYHDFFNATMQNLGLEFDFPSNFKDLDSGQKEQFFKTKYYSNLFFFERNKDKIHRYKSIFIDEVQDYESDWIRILRKYFLENNGELVVFGDDKQDIYNRLNKINNKKLLEIPDSPGRWSLLNRSFRLTPSITELAKSYQAKFMASTHELDVFEKRDFQSTIFDKVYFIDKKLDHNEIINFISEFSKNKKIHPNDICVLGFSINEIMELDYQFRKKTHEKSYIMSETKEWNDKINRKEQLEKRQKEKEIEYIRKNKKLHFWMNSGIIKFSTVHSFKGWEINTLFLIVENGIFHGRHKEIIYTGFTRCMSNLVIINSGDSTFTEFMESLNYIEKVESF